MPVILIISILCIGILPIYAKSLDNSSDTIFQPYWTKITQFNHSFNITSSGRADIESTLLAFDVDTIEIEAHLQQLINGFWVTIKIWTETSQDTICQMVDKWYVQKGYSYRFISTRTVYKAGIQVEKADYISSIKLYN